MNAESQESTEQLVRRLAELLPLQGPITAFAFLNPLQGMEDLPFIEALRQVSDIFGCEPFLPEGSYREKMARGRIMAEDLTEILAEEQGFDGEQKIAGADSSYQSSSEYAATFDQSWSRTRTALDYR
jgi:uncharacterized protein YbcC (UPF0753/DUF2309 family)